MTVGPLGVKNYLINARACHVPVIGVLHIPLQGRRRVSQAEHPHQSGDKQV